MEFTDKKIIIDTDLGDDIDDAFALEYAVKAGLDVVAVTTVFRSCYLRAELTSYLLRLMDRADIPVYAGEDHPLCQTTDAVQKPERNLSGQALDEVRRTGGPWLPHYLPEAKGSPVQRKSAVEKIIESAERYRDRLYVVAIGPLTNLARAIEKAQQTMRRIGGVYFMGGNVAERTAEWNVRLDPEAARIVFDAGFSLYQIGADQTWAHCMLRPHELRALSARKSAIGRAGAAMLERWKLQPLYRGKRPCLHDALAIAALVEPSCVRFEETFVRVGLSQEERAQTVRQEGACAGTAAVMAAVEVDEARFRRSMWQHLL